jgi:hypothetical protein
MPSTGERYLASGTLGDGMTDGGMANSRMAPASHIDGVARRGA